MKSTVAYLGPRDSSPSLTKAVKYLRQLTAALVVLSPLALADVSYAAGRVFFDDFEDGTTNKWSQDDFRNKCTVVTSAADGVAGPYTGSRMARCNWNGAVEWNDPASYETLVLNSISYSNELFFRIRLRLDKNFDRPGSGSVPAKILRIFTTSPSYNDMIEVVYDDGSLSSQCVAGGTSCSTYWGQSNDNTANSSGWHTVEWYFNMSTGTMKVWHDRILVRNDNGLKLNNAKWYPFYVGSNFSWTHDATSYAYFDDIEIYSDTGSGATGLLSDASISSNGSISGSGSGSGSGSQTALSPPQGLQVIQ